MYSSHAPFAVTKMRLPAVTLLNPAPCFRRRTRLVRRWSYNIEARRRYRVTPFPDGNQGGAAEVITILTADGMVRLHGHLLLPSERTDRKARQLQAKLQNLPSPEQQGLCIGSLFSVAAMNAVDPNRRINLQGFCQSVDLISEAVEDAVLRAGGEVLAQDYKLKHGLHEHLQMTVAVPYLFGVPPLYNHLSSAIETGGGVVERVIKEWRML